MNNVVTKGSYVNGHISYVHKNGKEVLCIILGNKRIYISKEDIIYCNLVNREFKIKALRGTKNLLLGRYGTANYERVGGKYKPSYECTYYVEMGFSDGKWSIFRVNEKIKKKIENNFALKEYALGFGNTKCDYDKYEISEEEKILRKEAAKLNKKFILAVVALLIVFIIFKLFINFYDRGYILSKENYENQEIIKAERLEEESKVWGYYEDTKEAMGFLTDELVNSEDSELEGVEKIAVEIETKVDNMWKYVSELERNDHNEKYYSACQEYITMCRIAAENIKEYTQDKDTKHLEIAIESLKNGEKSAENISEYRKDCLEGIGCSDKEIERIVGEKEQ